MKYKIYKILLPIYGIICLVLACGVIYSADAYPVLASEKSQYLLSLVYVIIGLVVGKVIHAIFHEIAHLLPLIGKKAVILEFGLLGFYYNKLGKDKKFGFKLSQFDGYVTFVTKNVESCGFYVYSSIISAGIGSFLSGLFCLVLFRFVDNYYIYCIFGGGLISCVYSLLVNFLSWMPTSDGILLNDTKNSFDEIICKCETQSRLYFGESLVAMPENIFYSEENKCNLAFSYLRSLQLGDVEKCKNLLNVWEQENKKTLNNRHIDLLLEKFYLALLEKDVVFIEKHSDEVVAYCDKNIDYQTLRVMIGYRKFLGDNLWAETLIKTFDNSSSNGLEGLYNTEKEIIDKFI